MLGYGLKVMEKIFAVSNLQSKSAVPPRLCLLIPPPHQTPGVSIGYDAGYLSEPEFMEFKNWQNASLQ
jgi:hypothetical protein